jgi:hypothetical protein
MHIENIATAAIDRLFAPMLRRALVLGLFGIFAVIALYHFTGAVTLGLEIRFGAIPAQLIVATFFSALALISLAIWWRLARKTAIPSKPIVAGAHATQLAMLIEAVMLGYSSAKSSKRTP